MCNLHVSVCNYICMFDLSVYVIYLHVGVPLCECTCVCTCECVYL